MKNKLTTTCIIRVFRRDGSLKEKRVVESDLLLANFIEYLRFLGADSPTLTDTNNNSRTISIEKKVEWLEEDTPSDPTINTEGWHDFVPAFAIAIGTGTTGPSRSDYSMGSEVKSTQEVNESWGSGELTWSATMTLASAADITETGFRCKIWTNPDIGVEYEPSESEFYTGSTNYSWFLMIRDTFTAISVASGESVSIAFKLDFQ